VTWQSQSVSIGVICGKLIDRRVKPGSQAELKEILTLPRIRLSQMNVSDLEMIAFGALSPLEGFMGRADYESVLVHKRLESGFPWTIPVTLPVLKEQANDFVEGGQALLLDREDEPLALLHIEEKYAIDKEREASLVFLTTETKHPGVKRLYDHGDLLLGGRVDVFRMPQHDDFKKFRLEPRATRALFREKGWRRVVGFQTRNPIHRAHEYIQKCALETVDGLLVHPLIGETKADDIPADIRMHSYEVLMEDYYPKDRTALSVMPAAMRYAGPREAIFHAIIRRNYGCTHFIVGRDHAGVGNYYGPFDAQLIFDEFHSAELGITPMFFDFTFYCTKCDGMASTKTCPHGDGDRVKLSGTQVREMLREGKPPPKEFTRPEVAEVLIEGMSKVTWEI